MLIYTYINEDQQSDKEFMVNLYLEFERMMFNSARKYTSQPDVVEDIVQESLLKLYGKINTIKPMSHMILAAYIRSTVRNTAINMLKEAGYDKCHTVDINDESRLISIKDIALTEIVDLSRYRELLSKIWPQLSHEDRVLLEGKYIFEFSDVELAKEIGCKVNSVRMKLTRARRHALSILVDQEGVKHFDEA